VDNVNKNYQVGWLKVLILHSVWQKQNSMKVGQFGTHRAIMR